MSIRERRETRLKSLEDMIRRTKDISIDRKYMDLGGDPWYSPRYLGPEGLVNGYNSRCMSNPLYPTYYRFESAYEQDKHRALIIECLLDLLGDMKHPCIRMAAAKYLGRFSNDDLKSSEKELILSRLRDILSYDPSPVVRFSAAETILGIDADAPNDKTVRDKLVAIALDDGDQGWILRNTNFSHKDLVHRGVADGDGLLAIKDRVRLSAFELLSSSLSQFNSSKLRDLIASAKSLSNNFHLEPLPPGLKRKANSRQIELNKKNAFIARLEDFMSLSESILDSIDNAAMSIMD